MHRKNPELGIDSRQGVEFAAGSADHTEASAAAGIPTLSDRFLERTSSIEAGENGLAQKIYPALGFGTREASV